MRTTNRTWITLQGLKIYFVPIRHYFWKKGKYQLSWLYIQVLATSPRNAYHIIKKNILNIDNFLKTIRVPISQGNPKTIRLIRKSEKNSLNETLYPRRISKPVSNLATDLILTACGDWVIYENI